MPFKLLIVDDDKKITAMMRRGFVFEGYEVTVASNGKEALLQMLENPADLVILDVMMPGIDGLEVCRRIKKEVDIPILMVTARDSVSDRVLGLETGADDYVIKPFAFEELAARVKVLLRRFTEQEDKKLTFSNLTLDENTRIAYRGTRPIDLSVTEFELLSLFLKNPQRVLTRDMIMEKVWGYDFQGESNVLDVYIGYLRRKLEGQNEPRLIHTVRGAGYVLKERKT